MFPRDITSSILNVLNDYETINNYCQVDQYHHNICLQNEFWMNLFDRHHFHYPNVVPTNSDEWKRVFRATYYTHEIISRIQLLPLNSLITFNYNGNIDDLRKILKKIHIHLHNYINTYLKNISIKYISIKYIDFRKKPFNLRLDLNNNSSTYIDLSLGEMRQFLYNILYEDLITFLL